ncbi:MAG: hypothetical protein R3C61_13485 [Bacteroidia bacterium]
MERRLLLLGLILGFSLRATFAQVGEVDVTKLTADTKTFIFSNNKNTVKGYIYEQLELQTACCGSDRIYLEVKIDPSGHVLYVKPLTGKNECFKQSAIDIVKNVKWETSDFKGPKSVYFEIKPSIDCSAERGNTYAQVEIFNNPLLDKQGNPTSTSGNPPSIASTPQTPATTQPATTQPQTAKTEPAADPNKQIASGDPVKPTTQPQTDTRSQEQTVGVPGSPGRPATTQPAQPATTAPATTSVNTQPVNPQNDELAAREDAERIAQEEEIRRLKERMEKLRAQEEEARERRLVAEKQQREKEARDKERQEQVAAQKNPKADNNWNNSGKGGGLFLDEEPASTSNPNTNTPTDPPAGASEEDRIGIEIASLEQQVRKIEEDKAGRDRELRDREQQNQRDNQELFKLKEEILRKQELANQQREQKELDRMEIERQRVEDQRRKEEDSYQRMMDEIKRLQDEAARKIADLERQKQDLDNLAAAKQAREQEIMLERVLRQKEQEAQLEMERLRLVNNSSYAMTSAANPVTPPVAIGSIPALTTKDDSTKYLALVQVVNQLRLELTRLQEQIALMEGRSTGTGTPSAGDNKKTASTKTTTPANSNAANDKGWEKIDYKKPGEASEIYVASTARPNTPPAAVIRGEQNTPPATAEGQPQQKPSAQEEKVPEYTPGKGYSPHPSHKETHANVAGPKFFPRNYVDGRAAMKEKIAESLKNGGVCGLGQAAFSVTLDPKGNVINNKVLASNSALVELQLRAILPTLKFNEVDITYDQTIYLEFKADIVCDAATDKVDLHNVQPIIKD